MQKFVDRRGRVWVVDIDTTTIRRVKSITSVNLLDAVDGDIVSRLSNDPILLCDVLYAVCKTQADSQNIQSDEFGEGLAGDVIDEATAALLEAILAYLPERKRRLLRKAAEKQQMVETRGLAAIEARLDDPATLDKIIAEMEAKISTVSSTS